MVSNYKSTPAFSFASQERITPSLVIAKKKAADPSPISYEPRYPNPKIPGGTFGVSRRDRFRNNKMN